MLERLDEETPATDARRRYIIPDTLQQKLASMAYDALSTRLLVWASSLSLLGCWWWTVTHPSVLGIIASGVSSGVTLIPILIYAAKE